MEVIDQQQRGMHIQYNILNLREAEYFNKCLVKNILESLFVKIEEKLMNLIWNQDGDSVGYQWVDITQGVIGGW